MNKKLCCGCPEGKELIWCGCDCHKETKVYTPLEACIYARNSLSGSMTPKQHRKTLDVLINAIENRED